jgi:hypothetical protein
MTDWAVARYHQDSTGSIVNATYSGGEIVQGSIIATVGEGGSLDMRYHHVNTNGDLKTGRCKSKPEILADGRIRLHEQWQWTCDGEQTGESIVEEVV